MLQRIALFLAGRWAYLEVSARLTDAGLPFPLRLACYTALACVALVACMYIWQEGILYQPAVPTSAFGSKIRRSSENPAGMRSPSEHDVKFLDVRLTASDGVQLHAWWIPASEARQRTAATLLFSHENAGNIGFRLQEFVLLHHRLGCNVLLYDYRGYGDSQDAPINEAGLMRDARAAWDWVLGQDVDTSQVFLYGRSLGGAVSIQLARDLCDADSVPLPAGLIVGNTFTSIEGVLGSVYPFLDFEFVKRHLLRLRWRSIEHIQHVRIPILMMVGLRDEIVPSSHTPLLKAAAIRAPSVDLHTVPNGTHNDTWLKAGAHYIVWLSDFMAAQGKEKPD